MATNIINNQPNFDGQNINIKQWMPEFDNYLLQTAKTSKVVCNWELLRELLRYRIKVLCDQKMIESTKSSNTNIEVDTDGSENSNPNSMNKNTSSTENTFSKKISNENDETVEDFQMRIWAILDSFDEPPFTIQRLCELVTVAKEQHKNIYKYLRAIEKMLLVTSYLSPSSSSYTTSTSQEENPIKTNINTSSINDDDDVDVIPPSMNDQSTTQINNSANNSSNNNKDTEMMYEEEVNDEENHGSNQKLPNDSTTDDGVVAMDMDMDNLANNNTNTTTNNINSNAMDISQDGMKKD